MTVVPRLLVGICLIATAYADGSQAGVQHGESLLSKLFSEGSAHSAASNCTAGGLPVPPVAAGRCPPTTYKSFGVISSSYYPNNYTNSLACAYQLKASDAGSTIQLWFGSFLTERRYDFVRIYDGTNSSAQLLATLTGPDANITAPFNSSGQSMYVTFSTDGSISKQGWFATFASVRKGAPTLTC